MTQLYLRKALTGWDLSKAKGKTSTGEQRGGAYVARVQTGYEKDGSPKYRYFDTEQEYESYLRGAGRKKQATEQKKRGKELKEKTKKERKEETKKQSKLFTAQAKKEKKEKVKKAFPAMLYLEVNDE